MNNEKEIKVKTSLLIAIANYMAGQKWSEVNELMAGITATLQAQASNTPAEGVDA